MVGNGKLVKHITPEGEHLILPLVKLQLLSFDFVHVCFVHATVNLLWLGAFRGWGRDVQFLTTITIEQLRVNIKRK